MPTASMRSRWVPPLVAAALVGGTAVAVSGSADAAPALPSKTPEQVLALIAQSEVRALSGTVTQTSNLGLPELPAAGGDTSSLTGLLTGSRTMRVWVDGPERARLQVLGQLAETNVVRNGRDLWTYRSTSNEATHVRLPSAAELERRAKQYAERSRGKGLAGATAGADNGSDGDAAAPTPEAVAKRLVQAAEPVSEVTVGRTAEVAGRAAYELQLRPRGQGASASLLEQATVSVDAETGLPLRVSLRARGQAEPAFDLAYTALDLSTPETARFAFTPPAGAEVEEKSLPSAGSSAKRDAARPQRMPTPGEARALAGMRPAVVGQGWAAAVVVPAAAAPDTGASPELDQVLASSTRPVPGGRLLETALVNVLITDDGRRVVGAVTPEALAAAAAQSSPDRAS